MGLQAASRAEYRGVWLGRMPDTDCQRATVEAIDAGSSESGASAATTSWKLEATVSNVVAVVDCVSEHWKDVRIDRETYTCEPPYQHE